MRAIAEPGDHDPWGPERKLKEWFTIGLHQHEINQQRTTTDSRKASLTSGLDKVQVARFVPTPSHG